MSRIAGRVRRPSAEPVRYAAVGLFNAALYFALYSAAVMAGMAYYLSVPVAFVVAASVGYFLHEYWTFAGRRPALRSLLAWLSAQVGAVLLSLGLLALLVGVGGLGPVIAQALLMPLAPLLAYLLGRTWIFTRP